MHPVTCLHAIGGLVDLIRTDPRLGRPPRSYRSKQEVILVEAPQTTWQISSEYIPMQQSGDYVPKLTLHHSSQGTFLVGIDTVFDGVMLEEKDEPVIASPGYIWSEFMDTFRIGTNHVFQTPVYPVAPDTFHKSVGILGVNRNSDFIKQVGMFAILPHLGAYMLYCGELKVDDCLNFEFSYLAAISDPEGRWRVAKRQLSMVIGGTIITVVTGFIFDTAESDLVLPPALYDTFMQHMDAEGEGEWPRLTFDFRNGIRVSINQRDYMGTRADGSVVPNVRKSRHDDIEITSMILKKISVQYDDIHGRIGLHYNDA